jgi:SAM-dependent methyltransferase
VINIESFIHDFEFKDGIWYSPEVGKISYPRNGNNLYYEIENQSFWFKYRNRVIYEVLKEHALKGPIFDVGGGNGVVSEYLLKMNFEAVLVEPGQDGCINGRERGLKNIIKSKIDNLHFYPNNIPNIGIFDVLEHVENQEDFLAIIHRNLIPNGRLFITIPACKFLWSAEDNYAGHYHRYRIKDLHKLLDEGGFEILYATYFFSLLVFPIFIFRTIPSKLGFYKINAQQVKNQHNSNSSHLLDKVMKFEINKIKKSKSILFGSSLILVAKKK